MCFSAAYAPGRIRGPDGSSAASFRAARRKFLRHLTETAWGPGRILPAPAYESRKLSKYLFNTVWVGIVVVVITLLISVPAAYSLERWSGKLGENLGIGIFMTYLVPPTLLFIPLSKIISLLGLHESLSALILIYPTFTIPFCTWLLMGFFKSIPKDIEEQAMIDGCSRFGAMVKIVFPLSVSGILTVVVFAFTLTMHEFIYALSFVSVSAQKTISVGVPTELVRGDVFRWGPLMAGALIPCIPAAILYTFFLDRFISGFTMGAVK
ncbi:carbohydrate ABC transporter permease [Desulfococcus sp.]|uniref:carbohydrate ABC transporter permease n=1 Tax=Desulfococcus sp. TaxID=2025834 RepID=UPI003D0C0D7B